MNVLKHHLIPALLPFEKHKSFVLTEQELEDFQVNDLFVQGFIQQVSNINAHCRKCFVPEAVDAVLDALVDQTCNRLQSTIGGMTGVSLYGGLQFDQDVRALMQFFVRTAENVPVRKKFKRLTQISSLLSLEHPRELRDFYSSQKWELGNEDIRRFLCLRFAKHQVDSETQYVLGRG